MITWILDMYDEKTVLTLHPEVSSGFGVGHLVGVLSNILRSGDDNDKAPDSSIHLAHHILIKVYRLTLLQPLPFSVSIGDLTLQLSCLRLCHCHVLQGPCDGSTWWQNKETFLVYDSGATEQHIPQ